MANLSRQFFKFHFGLLQLSQGQMLLARQLLSVQNSMTSQFSLWPYIYMGLLMEKEINVSEWINKTFSPIYFGRQTLSFIYFERRKWLQIIAKYTKRPWSLYFCTLRGGKILYVVGTQFPFWPTTIRVGLIPTGELGLLPVYVLHVCGWGLPQLNSSSLNIKSRKKHEKKMSSVQFLFVSF